MNEFALLEEAVVAPAFVLTFYDYVLTIEEEAQIIFWQRPRSWGKSLYLLSCFSQTSAANCNAFFWWQISSNNSVICAVLASEGDYISRLCYFEERKDDCSRVILVVVLLCRIWAVYEGNRTVLSMLVGLLFTSTLATFFLFGLNMPTARYRKGVPSRLDRMSTYFHSSRFSIWNAAEHGYRDYSMSPFGIPVILIANISFFTHICSIVFVLTLTFVIMMLDIREYVEISIGVLHDRTTPIRECIEQFKGLQGFPVVRGASRTGSTVISTLV
ncbi:hypothetical protein BU17DRAFT_71857 [Hysterangium stoloniferum]|nr:hypothetical protein BU17DRAFT_71857 [Hysterangium stoloniferum]